MNCNIDRTGRRLRAVGGILCSLLGIGLIVLASLRRDLLIPLLITGGLALLSGVFQIFESWKGWCAIRAMGFKTRW
jgi:hypothetical protein